MNGPTISAVMTVYNGERYVGEALASILSQTRPPREVVVVDDGSTDATPELLREFGDEIRVVRQANSGHAAALNRGFEEADGDYIAKCDADDIWREDKLERQADAIAAAPNIDIAFSATWVFGRTEGPDGLPETACRPGVLPARELARALYRWNYIRPSTTLMRNELYGRLGPFVEGLPAEDYDYWLRALSAGAVFYYDPEHLVRYRRHDAQITSDVLRVRRAAHSIHLWHADAVPGRRFVRSVLADDLRSIGRMLVDEGEPREARASYLASLRQLPSFTAIAWSLLLTAPAPSRRRLIDAALAVKRGLPLDSVPGS